MEKLTAILFIIGMLSATILFMGQYYNWDFSRFKTTQEEGLVFLEKQNDGTFQGDFTLKDMVLSDGSEKTLYDLLVDNTNCFPNEKTEDGWVKCSFNVNKNKLKEAQK